MYKSALELEGAVLKLLPFLGDVKVVPKPDLSNWVVFSLNGIEFMASIYGDLVELPATYRENNGLRDAIANLLLIVKEKKVDDFKEALEKVAAYLLLREL